MEIIFGGTFDPIHMGHLKAATTIAERLKATVNLVPAARPAHRTTPGVSAEHRAEMVALAVKDFPDLKLNTLEIDRPGQSFAIDTALAVRQRLGEETSICFSLGFDALAGIQSWERVDELAKVVNLLVTNRPGYKLPNPYVFKQWQLAQVDELKDSPFGKLAVVEMPPTDISATKVRQSMALGESDERYLSPAVHKYIQQHRLYGAENE